MKAPGSCWKKGGASVSAAPQTRLGPPLRLETSHVAKRRYLLLREMKELRVRVTRCFTGHHEGRYLPSRDAKPN